jgi:hypothetical protein
MYCAVTYDIDRMHTEVKAQCLLTGFMEYVVCDDGTVKKLPNTTLVVDAINCTDAANKFMLQVGSVSPSITVMKVVCFEYAKFILSSNQYFTINQHC